MTGLSAKQQIPTLPAIALGLLLFAKREKGIAGLINQYMAQLWDLGTQYPEARVAHLVILALKGQDSKKLQAPLQAYLGSTPQPGKMFGDQVHPDELKRTHTHPKEFKEIRAAYDTLRKAASTETSEPAVPEYLGQEPQSVSAFDPHQMVADLSSSLKLETI